MSAMKLNPTMLGCLVLLTCTSLCSYGASDNKDKNKKKNGDAKPAELFEPTATQQAQEARARNYAREVDAEVAARAVPMPPEMDLEVEWYSPHLDSKSGKLIKGWVRDDVVLMETDKHSLVNVRRSDGLQYWECQLNEAMRYGPAVSRNNVVVNCNNYLIAIEKTAGEIRWRLQPKFAMSTEPLVIDPPAYPKEYTRQFQPLEHIYVGGWDGRFYYMQVRARMSYYVKHQLEFDNFAAPEFSLFYSWHKTHKTRGIINTPIKNRDNLLYYAADDQQVYAVTRDGEERDPYYLMDRPNTTLTVTGVAAGNASTSTLTSIYVGGRDSNFYCLDRLTLKKKWSFPAGVMPNGSVYADDPATPYVYFSAVDGKVHALEVTPSKVVNSEELAESARHIWAVPGEGVISAGPEIVYIGLKREEGYPAYKGIAAVEKKTGKVLWTSTAPYFARFLEFHNSWSTNQPARIYVMASDNRLISLKEKLQDTGLRVVKLPEPEQMPKLKAKKVKKEGEAEEKKEGAAEEKKD